ncbi:hypothetical protein I5H06_gp64 [Mycobacterium phage SirPhilip]|uniref:Uncharacterized protein n=1 Tax=Mycobacterium phage SirPhilip TaxID=2015824 RepID=A0A222ZMJ2_9CAUD|nr:hypothetical protein I5H06_gp64 [Mycobacterium phage SirPhilip]ASR85240.1 hypothetical protein SEA_SIRPHILIP_38 [Mycobacterium phage SirPhilip]
MIVTKRAGELAVGDLLVNNRVGSPYGGRGFTDGPRRVLSVRKGEAVDIMGSMEMRPAIFYRLELSSGKPSTIELWLFVRSLVEVEVEA